MFTTTAAEDAEEGEKKKEKKHKTKKKILRHFNFKFFTVEKIQKIFKYEKLLKKRGDGEGRRLGEKKEPEKPKFFFLIFFPALRGEIFPNCFFFFRFEKFTNYN